MSTNKFIKEKKRFEPNRYALPQYWIRLQTNVQIFLDRMEKRIKTNSPLKFSRYKQSFLPGERLDRLFLEIGNGKYYHDLNIVAWVESKNKRIVGVDARASWRIKDPPSSHLYDRSISKFPSGFRFATWTLHLEHMPSVRISKEFAAGIYYITFTVRNWYY